MQKPVTTIIDHRSCTGCGLCVEVCPDRTITMRDGRAVVTGRTSIDCGHCEAVCPAGAVRVEALEHPFRLATVPLESDWLAPGTCDTGKLVRLMLSRRSCRNYQHRKVEPAILADLVKIGTTAPSGTNSQLWTFTVLSSRSEVVRLGNQIAGYFQALNRMAEKSWLRLVSKIFGSNELGKYYLLPPTL